MQVSLAWGASDRKGPLQVVRFEEETGKSLPATVQVLGRPKRIWLQRVVSCTDRRFLRNVSGLNAHVRAEPQCDAEGAGMLQFADDEQAAALLFFGIIDGEVPAELSLEAYKQLLAFSRLCMASKMDDALSAAFSLEDFSASTVCS